MIGLKENSQKTDRKGTGIMKENRYELNKQLAQMLKGGVIMDVTTPEQAKIAEEAGACAVMALERIPADIRAAGGVSRMSDPKMIRGIQEAVSIPVMAKCRIGHFVEAQILEAIEIDYIDESEVLSPADDIYHINKKEFKVPFVCGARDLGEALRHDPYKRRAGNRRCCTGSTSYESHECGDPPHPELKSRRIIRSSKTVTGSG